MQLLRNFILLFVVVSSPIFLTAQPRSIQKGIYAYNKGNMTLAVSEISAKMLSFSGSDIEKSELFYWYAKSIYQEDKNSIESVIKILNEAMTLDPKNIDAEYFLARLLLQIDGFTSEVKSHFLKLKDNENIPFEQRGVISLYLNGYERTYSDFINMEDNVPEQSYLIAALFALKDNPDKSYKELELALSSGFRRLDFLSLDFANCYNSEEIYKVLNSYKGVKSFYIKKDEPVKNDNDPIDIAIKSYVEKKVNGWQKKGKFEKSSDYVKRVTSESHREKVAYYTQQAIDSIGLSKLDMSRLTNEYDADNESFMLIFPDMDPVILPVPIIEAPSFDANFHRLEFNDISFALNELKIPIISKLVVLNPSNQKSYVFDGDSAVKYNSTLISFNFENIDIPLSDFTSDQIVKSTAQPRLLNVGVSDIDTDIPENATKNPNAYALVIGNEDYTKYQNNLSSESNVDFAKRDAEVFAKYAEKTLGVPKENITLVTDAISSQMNREIDKLIKLAKYSEGNATIIFYYAGHGYPDEVSKESYIMPVDISGAYVKDGISLRNLYTQLSTFPTKKTIVILDACFSGGGRNEGLLAARGVAIKPKEEPISGNIVVFTSSTGEQSSLPYNDKQHGMFTYFLLKKLQETAGDVTLEQLKDYVTKEVQINAVKINNKEQNPGVQFSPLVQNAWIDWKLGE